MKNYAIYVHIPFCKARCGYCAFSSCTNLFLQEAYFEKLCCEIENSFVDDAEVVTLFWGGGTPSVVGVEHLRKLFVALNKKFDLSHLDEFTVECNPESTTEELLKFFREIGVNRLSFGLQSANNGTLERIGRLHNFAQFLDVLQLARSLGFENINADLILGLPESQEDFCNTLNNVVNLPLEHISLYALEIHEGSNFQKVCEQFAHTDDQLADMYDKAVELFAQNGFLRYEVSNFAKLGFECAHNKMYWTENRYFGFGAAASGFVENVRYGNAFDIESYINGGAREYEEVISLEEEMLEFVMLGLRLTEGISLSEFCDRFAVSFEQKFPTWKSLADRGFLQVERGRIAIPADKFYVLNSILTELLPD